MSDNGNNDNAAEQSLLEQNRELRAMIEQLRQVVAAMPDELRKEHLKKLAYYEDMDLGLQLDQLAV